MSEAPTYYERWGPVARRVRRAGHMARYVAKTSLGLHPSILVELKWRLGDEIMALPIFEALRAKYPQSRIDVLTNYPDLFEDHPYVDGVNPERPAPDRYYLLRGAPRDVFRLEHYAREAEVEMPFGRPQLFYRSWSSPLLAELPAARGPLIAIAPGASWATKRWPQEQWRKLVRILETFGTRVFELGHSGEGVGLARSFVGRTSVRDAAILLHHADVAVTNDSGLMHLAHAAGTRVMGLFGPTEPELLIRGNGEFVAVTNGRDCAGCWNRGAMQSPGVCPLGLAECMDTISPERVAERVQALLGQG